MMMNKLKVLLIEDHLGERLNLIKFLSQYGAVVDTAITFQRARDLASKRSYDIVISELILSHCPELQGDGIQFWSFFQKLHPATPIFLIADESVRITTEMLMQGSMRPPIFSKPVNVIALKEIVENELDFFKKIAG